MEYKNVIENKTFDEERALYNLKDTEVINCTFAGKQDGESVLKETRNISVKDCAFSLRYPLWHAKKYELIHSTFDEKTRAPIWYSDDGLIENCDLKGIKLLRECNHTEIKNSNIDSPEFGWKCNDSCMEDTDLAFEYSEVEADIKGNVVSIKNPKSGNIIVDSVGEIINEDSIMEVKGKVVIRNKNE